MIYRADYWRPIIRPLVEQFGPEKVHHAALDYLGIPGWFVDTWIETRKLTNILNEKEQHNGVRP